MKERAVNNMATEQKNRFFLKLLLWFVFLSTLGVGGGIFFLLFAVVPIEQSYTDRGWSQFKIDSIMKYFVLGWVAFGFALSFVYYFFIVKKNRWLWSWILVTSTVLLTVAGLYYFLNTGSGLVQGSQGEIVEGERFTFGPYPEKEDLIRLQEQGYDGVITLLNPALPIEKPLLDKEKSNADAANLEFHSLPMLPWVGDNSKSIERAKQIIKQDDKKYYVHCYLGRHRVDVIKQVVNEELGDDTYALRFMQPTTLERGGLIHFPEQSILIGPYPTDEEWFTRIKRGEVKEIVSIMQDDPAANWQQKEQQVTSEMEMIYTPMPLPPYPTKEQLQQVVDYVQALDHKVYIHDFNNSPAIDMLEAMIDWETALSGELLPVLSCGSTEWIGRKMVIGCEPNETDNNILKSIGVSQTISLDGLTEVEQYEAIKQAKKQGKLTYFVVSNNEQQQQVKQQAIGLLYGSVTRGEEWESLTLKQGIPTKHERNLLIGPMLDTSEYDSFALKSGVAQLILLYSPSTMNEKAIKVVQDETTKRGITLALIPMVNNYEDTLIPLIEAENGLNYIMTDAELIPVVNAYIKKF